MNRADGDLRKNQLEALIDKFPAVAYRCRNDEQFTLEYVSGGIAAITGYPVEEFRSRRISYNDLVLPEDFTAAYGSIRESLHARGQYEMTYRIRNAAGEIRWMWDRGVAIKEGEEIVAIEGFMVDITDRQRMEHTLKTTDARLNLALQAARLGTWDWDMVTGAVIWSEAHERLWGFDRGAFRGTFEEVTSGIHEDDRALVQQRVQKAIDTRTEYNCDFRVVWPDRTVHWVAGRGVAQYDGALPVRMIGVTMDITERRELELQREVAQARVRDSERMLRDILDSMFTFVAVLTPSGVLVDTNRAPLEILGVTRDEVIGTRFAEGPWFPEATQKQVQSTIERAAVGETTRADMEVQLKSGEIRIVDATFGPLYDSEGVVTGIIGSSVDVTERRHAELLRQKLEAQLWQAQKLEALGTLAGGVAHDFNNILSVISGNVEIARQDVGPDHSAVISLNEIRKAAGRAKNVVQQILAFTRRQAMERRVISLQEIIHEAAAMLKATLPAYVELKVACAANAPSVLADPTQMHQVLLNLATNAWHALDNQPGTIEISLKQASVSNAMQSDGLHPGEYACITVTDTGIGMNSEALARAFEPFYTTKEVGKGSGLGLSVVEGIVKSHEGVIRVTSEPGKGSAFKLYFPAAVSDADFTNSAVLASSSLGKGQTILYLDDDEAIVALALKMLERRGYRVIGFSDPVQALQAIRNDPRRFDLVITDYTMPGISGLLAARQIAQVRPDLPVLLTSGYVTDDLVERATELNVREIIHKPYDFNALCETVERTLRGK